MKTLSIQFVKYDVFHIVAGSGWVIKQGGNRLDWPMLETREEALADLASFRKELGQLASDEASERHGLAMMGADAAGCDH